MFRIQRLAVVSLLLSMVAVVGAAEKSGTVKTTKNPKDGAEMVLIPAGQFLMGTGRSVSGLIPVRKISPFGC